MQSPDQKHIKAKGERDNLAHPHKEKTICKTHRYLNKSSNKQRRGGKKGLRRLKK